MRVLVLWENPEERDYACNLAEVLAVMAPSLAAEACVRKDNSIEMSIRGRQLPKVLVRAANYFEIFRRRVTRGGISTEDIVYDESVWDKPKPDPPPIPPLQGLLFPGCSCQCHACNFTGHCGDVSTGCQVGA